MQFLKIYSDMTNICTSDLLLIFTKYTVTGHFICFLTISAVLCWCIFASVLEEEDQCRFNSSNLNGPVLYRTKKILTLTTAQNVRNPHTVPSHIVAKWLKKELADTGKCNTEYGLQRRRIHYC
jgi:hypothetical protein